MKKLKDRLSFATYFFTCILIVFALFYLALYQLDKNKPKVQDTVPSYGLDTASNVFCAELATTSEGRFFTCANSSEKQIFLELRDYYSPSDQHW